MMQFVSEHNTPSDIKNGKLRLQVSVPTWLDNPSDEEIRNKVEGYASECELSEDAERSFARWYESSFADLPVLNDVHFREVNCAAYVSGYLSAARDMGHLPAGDLA